MADYWLAGMLDGASWHGRDLELAGRYIQPGELASDVMRETGLWNMKVVLRPSGWFDREGNGHIIDGRYQLIVENAPWRDRDYPLGREISRYQVVQNSDIAKAADSLIEADIGDEDMRLMGVGAVGRDGEIIFVQLAMPDFFVGGIEQERHNSHLLIGDNRKMGSTFYIETETRVECYNTWSMAISGVEPIPHSSHPRQWIDFYTKLYLAAMEHREKEINTLNAMFRKNISSDQVNSAIGNMVPLPKKTRKMKALDQVDRVASRDEFEDLVEEATEDEEKFEYNMQKAEDKRQAIADKMVEYQDTHNYGSNLYWLWGAVSEIVNHSDDFYYNGDSVRVNRSIIFNGSRGRELREAWETCVDLI